ncbi:MAG: hypothetical protein M0C28_33385 [Candidatus Moduliflexus flocculans]|nr:hypothetical protein [Candidatus Moduliflexus flocculans]
MARTVFDGQRHRCTWPPSPRPRRHPDHGGQHRLCRLPASERACRRRTASCRASSPSAAAAWSTRAASWRLALIASLLIILFKASVTRLIPLYAIGVFLSFTLSQAGMALPLAEDRSPESRARRSIEQGSVPAPRPAAGVSRCS